MFQLENNQHNYHNNWFTLIHDFIPKKMCIQIMERIEREISLGRISLVNHEGIGTTKELDGGGKYLHYILKGEDVRELIPEAVGIYHALLPMISSVTSTRTIISPHKDSDINVKIYPPNGGTLGWHYDTNGITVLLYLTDNKEAPLLLKIPKSHPAKGNWIEEKKILARSGMLLIMKGREIWHMSEAAKTETKAVLIFNFYREGDTWRPEGFDDFVYNSGQ